MYRDRRRKIFINIGIVTAVIATTSSIGVGGWFLFKSFNKKEKSNNQILEYGINFQTLKNNPFPFEIIEGPTAVKDSSKQEYYLGEEGRKKLIEKMTTRLKYGPEIFQIRKIIIGNSAPIKDEINGAYFPRTHEIFINPYYFANSGGFESNDIDLKAETIFQVIYHEYWHHMADTYFNSYYKDLNVSDIYNFDNNNIGTKIFNKDGEKEIWDPDFIKEFEEDLKYIIPTHDDSKRAVNTEKYYKSDPIDNHRLYWSIGTKVSAGQIFNQVNQHPRPAKLSVEALKGKIHENYYFVPVEKQLTNLNRTISYDSFIKNIYYKYSMEELFVRKFQQLTMTSTDFLNNNDGWYDWKTSEKFPPSALLEDALSYQYDINSYDHAYLDDGPFTNMKTNNDNSFHPKNEKKAKKLFNLYDRHLGHHKTGQSDNITFMMNKSNTSLIINKQTGELQIEKIDIDDNQIKFGGFLPNDNKNYVAIAFGQKDDDGNISSDKEFPIQTMDYKVSSKADLNSKSSEPIKGSKKFYVTKDYINILNYIKKQIFFISTEKQPNGEVARKYIPLTSIRNSDREGYVSTFRVGEKSLYSGVHPSNLYRANINSSPNNAVTIIKETI